MQPKANLFYALVERAKVLLVSLIMVHKSEALMVVPGWKSDGVTATMITHTHTCSPLAHACSKFTFSLTT